MSELVGSPLLQASLSPASPPGGLGNRHQLPAGLGGTPGIAGEDGAAVLDKGGSLAAWVEAAKTSRRQDQAHGVAAPR